MIRPVTSRTLKKMKDNKEKITMLTAYDFSTAKYIDECGVDSILIGDSLGMTILGYDTTIKVTIDDMLTFTKAVSNGVKRALVVADMPFLSYHLNKEQTTLNAGRLIQAGAKAVKLEGASDFILDEVHHLTQSGINVVGHLGFTPQYINTIGGYFVQGKSYENTIKMLNAAKKLEENGAFALVLEMVPEESAKYISENLSIPTIGIGAGKYCDGQVLVIDDILGKYPGNIPKFVKQYANIKEIMKDAISKYNKDVKTGEFPTKEYSFNLTEEERDKLEHNINK
ncbi:TPA: 3-methyl-2-oxobutanoate hydroxymethyltransferase [Candidatus Avigastranaerophilus faecigallinarum]|nr:3-methyl-2-oxobutanoate hydroxymethyltransferase [Candidatus Avigastranaerophilus faecigallinarum]